jgi:flagellar motor component MotA
MGKVTIFGLLVATVMLFVTFGKGLGVMRGGDVGAHLSWALATLVTVLGANLFAMFHAAQSDRLIRALRAKLEKRDREQPPD